MKKNDWDEKLKKRIKGAVQVGAGRLIWAFVKGDREYQLEKLLKRLPSEKEICKVLMERPNPDVKKIINWEDLYKDDVKAIHDLIKEKLK